MKKEIFFIPILTLLVIGLGIVRPEIVTGETYVFYEGLIKYTVSKYIEIDFGVGWRDLVAIESIRPGETKQVTLIFNRQTTYVYVTENTNTMVKFAVGIPQNSRISEFTIYIGSEPNTVYRGSYRDIRPLNIGETFIPSHLTAKIEVPLGTTAGQRSEGIILCVYDSALTNSICPAL